MSTATIRLAPVALLAVALAWASVGRAEPTGVVAGTVALAPMKPLRVMPGYAVHTRKPITDPDRPRAIVYLERDDGRYPEPADGGTEAVVIVGQEGYQFRPAVTAVRRGGRVSFPNRDDEFHNVFSYSPAKRFDLGRFRKDEESPVLEFDVAGLVKVYCEIHEHMRSLVLVLDTPWFTATDTDGRFVLAGVPPGDYRLRAFLPSEDILESTVQVEPGATTTVHLAR